eukprot:c20359_g1_i4.p1 GENE.c20359_g1_i4~~c20359_g1_i4.p1  ORF type:complete len:421 (+),score=71.83 c20359_g1_i4:1230-2492(+)
MQLDFGATILIAAKIIQNAGIGSIKPSTLTVDQSSKDLIILVSQVWYQEHSVYRTFYKQVASLKPSFRLALLVFESNARISSELFDEVIPISADLGVLARFEAAALEIEKRKPVVLFYPDVGMSGESVFLANLRLAPRQIATYGHSVSTFGALIDFWIASKEVELLSCVRENYSERLLLVDGLGVTHTLPFRPPRMFLSHSVRPLNSVVINIAWAPMKISSEALGTLKEIAVATSASTRITFRFFPGMQGGQLSKQVLDTNIREAIGGSAEVEILKLLAYADYLEELSKGDMFLDSYPYGGCNTVMDALILFQPVVTRRGTRWHNRIGPAQLDKIGLGELVAETRAEFIEIATRLASSSTERSRVAERIARADLNRLTSDESSFTDAVRYAIAANLDSGHDELFVDVPTQCSSDRTVCGI